MLALRKCSNGQYVFDCGDYVEFCQSARRLKVYTCSKGRFIRQGAGGNQRVYIQYFKEE